ncbi:MAG: hypothetical protein AAFX93_01005 [Verrucomicrobiota bacterium]
MLSKFKQLFSRSPAPEEPKTDEAGDAAESDDERVYSRDEKDTHSWLGIGLDGVLSERTDEGLSGPIGAPVPDMIARIEDWTKHKRVKVKILTARAATEEGRAAVGAWLAENGLERIEFTNSKDLHMVEFWDDHAVQVIANMGVSVGYSPAGLDPEPEADEAEETAGDQGAK